MIKVVRYLILPAVFLASGVAAQAQLSLPGKTLRISKPTNKAGIVQPAKNPKNILKGPVTPTCPFIGMELRELLVFARANCPDVYRAAVAQRRTGFTKPQTRQFLEDELCIKWELGTFD
jgi:hypothetical protein